MKTKKLFFSLPIKESKLFPLICLSLYKDKIKKFKKKLYDKFYRATKRKEKKVRLTAKEMYERHKIKIQAKRKENYHNNKELRERIKEQAKEYAKNNKEKIKIRLTSEKHKQKRKEAYQLQKIKKEVALLQHIV